MYKQYIHQSIFVIIRLFVWFYLLGLAPDITKQLNMAVNLSSGHGLKLGNYNVKTMEVIFFNYFDHPPLFSIILGLINYVLKNILVSMFLCVFFLTVIESWIINRVLILVNVTRNKFVYFLIFSFYIGHIDRGTLSDYAALIFALVFLLFLFKIITIKIDMLSAIIFLFLGICIPFLKYSLLPLIGIPILIFIFYKYVNKTSYASSDSPPKILFISSVLSFGAAYFMIMSQNFVSSTENYFALDIYNLLKIDFFWLHFGLDIDRIYKHISWNILEHLNLKVDFWNIAQIITIPVFFYVIFQYSLKNKSAKLIIIGISIIALLQIVFLMYLTVTNIPQSPVKYGIDSKVWVFVEESRYYNYLTLLCFMIFTVSLVDIIKSAKWFLLLFVFLGYFNKCSLNIHKSNFCTLYNFNHDLKHLNVDEIVKIPNQELSTQERYLIFVLTGIEKR
jgi:hypothetical protein